MARLLSLPLRFTDRHWIMLLAAGFVIMMAGSWFNQFNPDRQARAARLNGQEIPAGIHPHSGTSQAVYAEASSTRP